MTAHVAIVGAGVVGVATAYAFASRGHRVTVFEASDAAGMGTSYANGAQLSYLYTDALASPYLRKDLPRLAMGADPAFRMAWRADPDYWKWVLSFLRETTPARNKANTEDVLRLGLESQGAMADFLARHSIGFDYASVGKVQIYRSDAAFERALQSMALKRAAGGHQQALTLAEATAIDPALRDICGPVAGVIHAPTEAIGDAHKFCREMCRILTDAYGAHIHFSTSLTTIDTADKTIILRTRDNSWPADAVIVCTGFDDAGLLRSAGQSLPILPMKGYSVTLPATAHSPTVSVTDTARRIVFARLGDRVRIAGMAELGRARTHIDPGRVATLLRLAAEAMPRAADYAARPSEWAGLRPMTPDSRPRIGWTTPRIGYALGHGMLGWTLAMGTGERLAQSFPLATNG